MGPQWGEEQAELSTAPALKWDACKFSQSRAALATTLRLWCGAPLPKAKRTAIRLERLRTYPAAGTTSVEPARASRRTVPEATMVRASA